MRLESGLAPASRGLPRPWPSGSIEGPVTVRHRRRKR